MERAGQRNQIRSCFIIAFTAFLAGSPGVSAQELHAQIVPQLGQSGTINSLAFSPDGQTVLTGSTEKTAFLWDVATGRELRKFVTKSEISAVAFSPDGRSVFTGSTNAISRKDNAIVDSSDNTAWLWDVATGRRLRQFKTQTGQPISVVASAAFSPDGQTLLTGNNGVIARLWDVTTGTELRRLTGHTGAVNAVAFSRDGRTVLTGSRDKTARLWDVASGRELRRFTGHSNFILSVAFSPDGRSVLTGSEDSTARLWDVASGRELQRFNGHTKRVNSVAFSPDGRTVLTGSPDNTARLWDVASGRELKQFVEEDSLMGVSSVAFSPNGQTVLTGGDSVSRLWDVASGRELRQFKRQTTEVNAAAFAPDGHTILMGSDDKIVRLWDASNGRELRQFTGHTESVSAVAFSPDGRSILSGGYDNTVRLWDTTNGREIRQFTGHTESVNAVAFSPDGHNVLTGSSDNTARLWDAESGRELRQFTDHANSVDAVAFSPNGRGVLTANTNDAARLWDVSNGQALHTFKNAPVSRGAAAFSPDGRSVLVGGSASLWDVASGQKALEFKEAGFVTSLAFSPDGQYVLTGNYDGIAQLWGSANGRKAGQFTIGNGVTSLAYSPDGRTIMALNQNAGTTSLWNASTGAELASRTLFSDGSELTITPEGFFDLSSQEAASHLSIVRGTDIFSVNQVYNALYRPDLVREKLTGDPDGKVKAAAAQLDLDKVMASGMAPKVTIVSPAAGSALPTDEVSVEASVADQGGGIGKVEWRINGVTLGLESRGLARIDDQAGAAPAKTQTVKRTLSLEAGDNRIEVLAYNAKGLIASEPVSVTVKWDGAKTATPPKLYVLAVGVNDYYEGRLHLSYAVPDATALADAFRKAGNGLYAGVEVKTVLDSEVTLANLDKVFAELSQKVQPRDVFVFFLAGHGKTKNGRYYFLPRDFRYEDESSIEKAGMGQDKFQAWFAEIPARKSLLLYDTCESGSLTGANARGSDIDERLGALNRMARATGRTFLTATTDDAPALEGYHGHGVFTYALLDAFDHADVNNDGLIEISELADYVDRVVPDISYDVFKLRQIPQRSIVGNNFALTNKAEILATANAATGNAGFPAPAVIASSKPTHVVIAPADVYEQLAGKGTRIEQLPAGTLLSLVRTEQGWALVAKDGKQIGYVAEDRLARVQ